MDLATIDHLLLTTHSVRKRLDLSRPVAPEIIERCIEIATHAPTGGNRQGWHFFVLTDAHKREQVADYYRRSWYDYNARRFGDLQGRVDEQARQTTRVRDSAQYLADHLHEVPLIIFPCIEGRVENAGVAAQAGLYGSILPAAWSLMLALRTRGLGAAWTTLHLVYEKEVTAILGIPDNVTQAAMLPVAYFTGSDFKASPRLPAQERTHWNTWGARRGEGS